jgi:putative phosphotransacetylase
MFREKLNVEILSDQELVDVISEEIKSILENSQDFKNIKRDSKPFSTVTTQKYPRIPLGISNRHIHLTAETFHTLFGGNTDFEPMRPLYQPGEFASKHFLTIVGPKLRSISNVRILGPLRKYNQVEVSLTDAIFLGIDPPVTDSGSLDNAAPLTLVGPDCSIFLKKCAIIANRHIHMSPKEAEQFKIKNGE